MEELEHEIDELLTSLIADIDEWEGGLLCTPENRKVVGAWLTKHRLTQRTPDLWDSAPLQALSTLKANPLAEHLSTPPTSG